MLHILQESGAIPGQEKNWEKIVEACENSGGLRAGELVDVNHGAGIWISPPGDARSRNHDPVAFGAQRGHSGRTAQIKIFGLVKGRRSSRPSVNLAVVMV